MAPIEHAVPLFEHVVIDEAAIERFAATIGSNDLNGTEFQDRLQLLPEQHIALAFVYNAVNFSFWGEPKWTIAADGQQFDGSAGMLQALRRGIAEGFDLLNAHFLAQLDEATLSIILRGNVQIPLFAERLRFLNLLGQHIVDNYGGAFANFVNTADWDAGKLVLKLAAELPDVFDDSTEYRGQTIHFYKRAQLVPAHLHDLCRSGGIPHLLRGFDQLTAFADYKVPQLMRSLGIIAYSASLEERVDAMEELSAGSDEELEIRMATIWANELCTRAIRQRIPTATAAQVDGLFWFAGQRPNAQLKPYHRTCTTNY